PRTRIGRNYTPAEPVCCALPGASCGKRMIASTLAAASNHHRGRYTSPALADASYPFVDLPPGNTLRCKQFPSGRFTIKLFPKVTHHSIIKPLTYWLSRERIQNEFDLQKSKT
ncbi:hypothetical protein ACP5WN_17265, partial [Enterocloster clostridioformis]|uniref:hypothetical protein n=1 Tax=Enterocloster clostridioformis TaxID=1531 RepID=UPI00406970FE